MDGWMDRSIPSYFLGCQISPSVPYIHISIKLYIYYFVFTIFNIIESLCLSRVSISLFSLVEPLYKSKKSSFKKFLKVYVVKDTEFQ